MSQNNFLILNLDQKIWVMSTHTYCLFNKVSKLFHKKLWKTQRYEAIFGREMWKHVVSETTFWSHSEQSVDLRMQERGQVSYTIFQPEFLRNSWRIPLSSAKFLFGVFQFLQTEFCSWHRISITVSNQKSDEFWKNSIVICRILTVDIKNQKNMYHQLADNSWFFLSK